MILRETVALLAAATSTVVVCPGSIVLGLRVAVTSAGRPLSDRAIS